MPDPDPNLPGAPVPPKPGEAAKVQPKKETVRISLPPKPSSSPTIKLPTLPTSGPAAPVVQNVGVTVAGSPASSRPPTAAGAASPAPAIARPPTSTGGPVSRPAGAPGAAGPRPIPSSAVRRVSGLDIGLGIAAAIVGLAAVACMFLLLQIK